MGKIKPFLLPLTEEVKHLKKDGFACRSRIFNLIRAHICFSLLLSFSLGPLVISPRVSFPLFLLSCRWTQKAKSREEGRGFVRLLLVTNYLSPLPPFVHLSRRDLLLQRRRSEKEGGKAENEARSFPCLAAKKRALSNLPISVSQGLF